MKILALDQGEYIGGAELFFSDLLTRVSDEFEIHLITGANQKYQARYKNSKVILHELELPALKPLGIKSYKKYRKAQEAIQKIITEVKPDKILSNTVRTHLLVSPLAQKKNIPLIWMAHDKTFPKLFLKWFKKYPQKIVSCSKFIEAYYEEIVGQGKASFEVLYPFGIDANELNQLNKTPKEKVIGMVGKFIPWKAQNTFIEVVQKIHQFYPEYRFEIIGSPYEDNEESKVFFKHCEEMIKNFKLQEKLIIKSVDNDVLQEISRWEILVHCSKAPEPLGRVVLEGMATSCAVIASNLGGAKEILRDRENGLIVEPSSEKIVEAIKHYLKDPQFMQKIADKGQAEVGGKYDWKMVIQRFKNILD